MGYHATNSMASLFDGDQLDEVFRRITVRCGERLKELVELYTPVATDPFGERLRKPGTLKESWELGEIDLNGVVYSVDVFSTDSIARYVEYNTAAHRITAKPGHVLRWRGRDGTVMYAHSVWHPGTTGQRMMGRAIATLAQEWQGIAREELRRG